MTGADPALEKVLFLGARSRAPYMWSPSSSSGTDKAKAKLLRCAAWCRGKDKDGVINTKDKVSYFFT